MPRAVILLAIGLAVLAGATAAFYFCFRDAQLLSSYNSAPVCPTLTDALAGKKCRYSGTATVLYMSQESGTAYIYFALPGLNDRQFSARLPLFIRPDSSAGDQVPVEFWSGHVTRLGDAVTADNPKSLPRSGDLLAIGVMLVPLGVGVTLLAAATVRRARGDQTELSVAATMTPIAASDALFR